MKESIHNKRFTLRGKALDVSAPLVMGILNVTPDSFSDGGSYATLNSAIKRVDEMINQGADLIDIGGESTRPGSDPVPEDEELNRVVPVLKEVIPRYQDVIFSLDTTKYNVARQGLESGVHIINDVSGLQNGPRLAELCLEFGAGLIIMHSPGNPKTMQDNPVYDDVIADVSGFLKKQGEVAESAGVESIIIDPGIGFGKTLEHNLKLLAGVDKLAELGYPVLIGASRKSMFAKLLEDRQPSERVAATLATHYHSLMLGASILRVHDVREAKDGIEVFKAIQNHK